MAKIYCKSSYLLRKDTAENWKNKSPVLRKGEQGLETDTGIIKIGDGVTAFNSLSDDNIYFPKSYASNNFANALKGTASGVSVRLDGVSPIEHTLGVKVSSKNLFTPNATPVVPSNMGVTCTYDSTDNTFTLNGTLAISGNIVLATLNIPLDDYYIARYYVSGDITAPEEVEYESLFGMFVYGASTRFLKRLSQKIDNYNTPIIAAEAKNIYSISSANKWTFYLQNFGVGTVFNNYKFKIAVIKKDMYYADIPYTPNVSDFSTVKVTRFGKNLIPYPYVSTSRKISGVTFTIQSDGSITVNGTATANVIFALESDATMFTLPVGNYFLSGCPSGGSTTSYFMVAVNGAGITYDKFLRDFGSGISVPSKGEKWKVSIRIISGYTANNLVFKPQLELGSTATAYEPYTVAEYTPAADGTVSGVTSLYPTTTLMTDTEGAIIEAEYNRDINKAFAELQQAIISLGGNV